MPELEFKDYLLLILGAVIGVVTSYIFYEISIRKGTLRQLKIQNKEKEKEYLKRKKIDYNAIWISHWKTNYFNSHNGHDIWVTEKLKIEPKNGKIYIKNSNNSHGYDYEGECDYFGDNYLYGTWQSTKSTVSKGLIVCIISTQADYLYGEFIGKNSEGKEEIGPWVIAKDETFIRIAKEKIKDPNYLFKSDSSIQDLREIFHLYHLTQMNGENIWRHHEIDFTQIDNSEVLVSKLKTTNKQDRAVYYRSEAGKCGSHFIMFDKNVDGKEEPSIWLFPFMCKANNDVNYGIVIGENWDSFHFLGKAIISREVYKDINQIGTLSSEHFDILEQDWTKNYLYYNKVPADLFAFGSTPVTDGTDGIYVEVNKQLENRRNFDEIIEVDILGYTLFSVDPKLKDWYNKGYLRSITINLLHLDLTFINENNNIIHNHWSIGLQAAKESITTFIEENKGYLKDNNVTINFYPYSHIPVIHGFKLDKLVHFVSIASWESNGRYINMPNQDAFMKIESSNTNRQALAMKNLFNNWVYSVKQRSNPTLF